MAAADIARESYAGVLADLRARVRESHRALRTSEATTKSRRDEYEKAKVDLAAMESIARNRGMAVVEEKSKAALLPLTPVVNGEKITCGDAIDLILLNSPDPLSVGEVFDRLCLMKEKLNRPPANRSSVSTMLGSYAPKRGWAKVGQSVATRWLKKGGPR